MHRELEQRAHHRHVAVRIAGRHGVDPARHRRFVVPPQAVPASHPETVDDPDRARGMALHDRGPEHLRQHHQVAFGSRRPVEHHPLVGAVEVADEPARQPVGEEAHPVGIGGEERARG